MSVDTNIDDYTISEMLDILGIDDENYDANTVTSQTNMYASQFAASNNSTMSSFFTNMQQALLANLSEGDGAGEDQQPDQSETWFKNESVPQPNQSQADKTTDRFQQIDVYDNHHVPMNKTELGVNNTFSVPVAQDKLNPNLENVTTRFINLDSKFRQNTRAKNLSTDYTLDLSETLVNVLSLRLYSYQIPYGWYTFDASIGNNCFWIDGINVKIRPGNYNPSTLVTALTAALTTSGFTDFPQPPVSYDIPSGILSFYLFGGTNTTTSTTLNTNSIITFWDLTGELTCKFNVCVIAGIPKYNNSLGYLLGFRTPTVTVNETGNIGDAVVDLYGPKYLILAIDDYNQNRINNGLIGITEYSKTLKVPSYFNHSLPYFCIPAAAAATTTTANTTSTTPSIDKTSTRYTAVQQMLPSEPRHLTQSQIYAINEITKNNASQSNYNLKSPTTTDTFAIIPFKKSGLNIGDVNVDFSGSLQDNKRIYFGPVTIERFHVMLYDDKGNILNLNGLDWSVTLIAEVLYQY